MLPKTPQDAVGRYREYETPGATAEPHPPHFLILVQVIIAVNLIGRASEPRFLHRIHIAIVRPWARGFANLDTSR